jgi:hypothetical protein
MTRFRMGLGALAACAALLVTARGVAYDGQPPPQPPPAQPPPTPTETLTRTVKLASLDGAQETPPRTTTAFGAGALEVDESNGRVRGFVVTSGLVDVTAAHVHLAARGSPGGIIVPLTGGPDLWVVPDTAAALTADQIDAFRSGSLYFNVHTAANPDGEIRGQIDKTGTVRLASLNGEQETPPVSTTALGSGMLAIDEASGNVAGFIVTSGLIGMQAHVHQAARGTPGGIIVPLTGGPGLWVVPDNSAAVSPEQRAAFAADGLYYNVHTQANPGGEIRGQLDKTGALRFAALDGAQETPPVATAAFGAGAVAVDDESGEVSGFAVASGLPTANAVHVHQAARGTPGPIIVPMIGAENFWVIPDNAAALAAEQRAAFTAGGLYENIHTPAYPSGEIRGQLD